ncbi:MAG: hypothetical protein HWE14_03420 [Flavobacteriia bacterium]|nr:hypothetical protein [Flavobacteriia bacterium]
MTILRDPRKEMYCIVLSFLFLVLGATAASAQSPYFRTSYELSSFNDGWGGGFSEIHDDGRSLGMRFSSQFNLAETFWLFDTRFSGITRQRFAKQRRSDELFMSIGVPVYSIDERLQVHGIIGFYSFGNLGLSAVQNQIHERVGTRPVDLAYEVGNITTPVFGFQVRGTVPFQSSIQAINSGLQGSINCHFAPEYLQSFRAEAAYFIQSNSSDRLIFTVGFNYQTESKYFTQTYVSRLERGPFYGVSTQVGGALYKFEVYPNQGFSLGSLGFALEPNHLGGTFSDPDFTFELGMVSNQNGLYQRFLIPAFKSKYFSFDLHHQFWSMTWKRLDGYPNSHGHDRQLSGGFQVSPFTVNNKFQVLPYISLRTGWRAEYRYSGMESSESEMYSALFGIAEGGLRVKLPAKLLSANCAYGFTCFYTTRMEWIEITNIGSFKNENVEGGNAAYGLGVFVVADL